MKKYKVKIFILCLVVIIIGSGIYFVPNISKADENKETGTVESYVQRGSLEGTFSASGTTTTGTDYEYFDVYMNLDTSLEVEKVYVETGIEVTTQSAILKVTKNSYDITKANLEKILKQAKNTLQEAKITYKTDMLTLKSKYASDISSGEIARESYENTIENLELQVKQAKEEYEEAKNIISQYPKKITENTQEKEKREETLAELKAKLKIATEKKETASKEYEKAKTTFENMTKEKEQIEVVYNYIEKYTKNNKTFEKDNKEEAMISQDSDLQAFIEKVNNDMNVQKVSYQAAQKEYTQKKATLEKWQQAVEKKETTIETKEKELETLNQTITKEQKELTEAKKQVNNLQLNYEQAISNRENQSVTAKKELEQNLLNSQEAEVSYEIELAQLEENLKEAKESYKEAKEVLKRFQDSFKNYIWYTKRSGTLQYLGYEEGDSITNSTPILGYYNGDTISIEISVDQSERSAISVGDEVTVVTDSMPRGTSGVISKISNTKNSTSVSKVTYGVTISINNEEGNMESGESATVLFATNKLENVLYIAKDFIQKDEQGSYVMVKEESGETRKVEIVTGLETGTFVEIKDGLKEGDCCVFIKSKERQENVE